MKEADVSVTPAAKQLAPARDFTPAFPRRKAAVIIPDITGADRLPQ